MKHIDFSLNIPGSSKWTEEDWERLAEAIGATLVPLEEKDPES